MTAENHSAQARGRLLIQGIVEAHLASIEALRILKGSSALQERLAVLLREHHQYSPERSKEVVPRTKKTIERAQRQARDDFVYLRKALLISLCSAIEMTVKEVVVERLIIHPEFWPDLVKEIEKVGRQPMISPRDYHAAFHFVDQNFKNVPRKLYRSGHSAIFRFWLRKVDQEPPIDPDLDKVILQAFHARNLAIHGSARAREMLKRSQSGFLSKNGDLLITQKAITEVRDNIQSFVEGIGLGDL